jgi:hypothetical protein
VSVIVPMLVIGTGVRMLVIAVMIVLRVCVLAHKAIDSCLPKSP